MDVISLTPVDIDCGSASQYNNSTQCSCYTGCNVYYYHCLTHTHVSHYLLCTAAVALFNAHIVGVSTAAAQVAVAIGDVIPDSGFIPRFGRLSAIPRPISGIVWQLATQPVGGGVLPSVAWQSIVPVDR